MFSDPENDAPRPVRSRKQRRPPCNATEFYHFFWTLYIYVKGNIYIYCGYLSNVTDITSTLSHQHLESVRTAQSHLMDMYRVVTLTL